MNASMTKVNLVLLVVTFMTITTPTFASVLKPVCAKPESTFCSDVNDYPQEQIEKILSDSNNLYAGCSIVENIPKRTKRDTKDVDGEPVCESQEQIIYPKVGLTATGEWSYIVNLANYTQGLRVEVCVHPGADCIPDLNLFGRSITCQQKYITHTLRGFNKEGNVENMAFKFPSACQCVIKHME